MSLGLLAAAAVQAAPVPPDLKPLRVAGSAFNVIDLEGQRDWYVAHLGMTVVRPYPATGKPTEYIMAMSKSPNEPVLVLNKAFRPRPAGPNAFGRLILLAPNPKALAARLAGEGVPMREGLPDLAYFVTDPEGNTIELYRAPAETK